MNKNIINDRKKKTSFIRIIAFILLIGLVGTFSKADTDEAKEEAKYSIGSGDVMEVYVWNHPELTKEVNVRPDGWVNLPLAGEILASGTTPEFLSQKIREQLLRYIKDPQVSIIVSKFHSKKILVLGEVKKPGLYQYEAGITAFDALGLADGYSKHAQLKSILVVRNPYSKQPEFYLANLYKVIHDYNTKGNVMLQPGDIVYVPQNFIGDLGDFMDYFLSRVRPAADTYYIHTLATK